MNTVLNILWINVNGCNKSEPGCDLGSLLDRLNESEYHMLCMQETNYNSKRQADGQPFEKLCALRGMQGYFTANEESTHGVATVLTKRALAITSNLVALEVVPNRCQLITLDVGGETLVVGNLYAPRKGAERPAFFRGLAGLLPKHVILGGDFNCVIDTAIDTYSSTNSQYENTGWQQLLELQANTEVVDGWREQHGPQAREYTKITTTEGGANLHASQGLIECCSPRQMHGRHHGLWIFRLTESFGKGKLGG